jgi:hypothetical protein
MGSGGETLPALFAAKTLDLAAVVCAMVMAVADNVPSFLAG